MDIEESEMNMLSSDDDEEEDDDDDESGDESSESDEETGDDDEDYESEEEIVEEVPDKSSMNVGGSKSCSSDDDPERESCPVCLNKFKGQELGTPESCDHTFCFDCIQEWSKNINTCPIDRTEFNNIYLRVAPGGNVLRKVKVKVLPKEPEDALADSVTLCEICRRGDREDRLLLCDGCDLAFHCECLDPPLFYIPIEEWFCPPCSGVFDNRSVAGPSRARNTTRRVIPRTRASETVRSRVQNLRGVPSCSSSRTNTTKTPKKRRRRVYRKAIKKVVTLARTKKDMNDGLKGKSGCRGSTVIVTYRRRRRRRRKTKRRVSKKSAASNKAISIPSSKVRIAKRLGISKPLQGSTVPQVKHSTGARSRSSALMDKMPTHSLFGNKDQLMDFSENFNEDLKNESKPSTSREPSTSSSSSGINILDSILAGQKILHAKPDKILIKTDGSLILKEGGSNVKKQESVRKLEVNRPSHTPMSVALAKQGVRTSVNEKSSSLWKKHSDVSKTKNISDKKVSKPSSDCSNSLSKVSGNSKYSANHTKPKSYTDSSNNSDRFGDKSNLNSIDKRRLSSLKMKRDEELTGAESSKSINLKSRSEYDNLNNSNSGFSDSSSKTTETCKKTSILSDIARNNLTNFFSSVSLPNTSNRFNMSSFKIPRKKETLNDESCNEDVITSTSKVKIKQEDLSAEENVSDLSSSKTERIHIKQEVLSDDETNDCFSEKDNIQNNKIPSNIKKEPIDTDHTLKSVMFDAELTRNSEKNISESMDASENNSSDFDASQSIIDSESYDVSFSSNARNTTINPLKKVKEEPPSDSEEFSQSLLFANDTQNSDIYSDCKSSVIQNKVPSDSNSFISDKAAKSNDFSNNEIESDDDFPCTQALVTESNISDDDDGLPPTQAVSKVTISNPSADGGSDDDDDYLPSTQAVSKVAISNPSADGGSDDDDDDDYLPSTQAVSKVAISNPSANNCSDDDDDDDDYLPSTQAVSKVAISNPSADDASDDDDYLPSTQVVSKGAIPNPSADGGSDDDDDDDDYEIPSAQVPVPDVSDSDDNLTSVHDAITSDENDDDNLPPTQVPASDDATNDEDDDLPCTQAVFLDTMKEKITSTKTAFGTSKTEIAQKILSPSQKEQLKIRKNVDSSEEIPATQANFDFLKPAPVLNCTSLNDYYLDELPPTQAITVNVTHKSAPNALDHQVKSFKTLATSSSDLDHMNDCTLTPTQVVSNKCIKQSTNLKAKKDYNSELSDIPATQKSDSVPKSVYEFDLPDTQVFKVPSEKLSNIQTTESNDEKSDLPDTEDFPATQISNPVLNESNKEGIDTEVDNLSMNNILSNIKQLVNSLSKKDAEIFDFNKKSEYMSKAKAPEDCTSNTSNSAVKLAEQSDLQNKVVESMQAGDSQSKVSDDSKETTSKNKKTQENAHHSSDSENDDLTPEKIKEALKKSAKAVTPKKSGIHKHLPQVITTVPVKEHLKIKPSYKRTFSFEEVAKQEGSATQQNLSNSSLRTLKNKKMGENIESSSTEPEDFLPATQKFDVVNTSTESSNEDSLPATQIQPFESEKIISSATLKNVKKFNCSTGIQKSKLPSAKEKETEKFPANGFFPENFPANGFFPENIDSQFDISNTKNSSFDHMDSDDLPATQLCQNIVKEKLSEKQNNSDSSTNFNLKRKHPSHETKSKKAANEQNMNDFLKPKGKYLSNANITKDVKKSAEIQNSRKTANFVERLKTNKCNIKQTLNDPFLNDKHNLLSLDYEKELSSQIIDSLTEKNFNKIDNIQKIGICHPVKIKQEKIDFEFIKPLTTIPLLRSEKAISGSNLNGIKIKTEDPDDLPPTQAVNLSSFDDDSLPPTQVTVFEEKNKTDKEECDSTVCENMLSASEIKKEPSLFDDDDEVTVIELNLPSKAKVKEEIILIDDDDISEDIIHKASSQNQVVDVIQEGKVTSSEMIDTSSIKREKHDISRVSSISISEIKTKKLSNEDLLKGKRKKIIEKTEQKINSDHSKSELIKSQKYIKSEIGSMDAKDSYSKVKSVDLATNKNTDSKESHSLKGEKKKDSKISKDKRFSDDSCKSVEKGSKNCKNSHSSKDKTQKTSKDFHQSVEMINDKSKNNQNLNKENKKNSKEPDSSNHKSRKMSEDPHKTFKTSKEPHTSKETSRKMSENSSENHKISKESHSLKDKSRKMSEDSHKSHKNTKESHASKQKHKRISEDSHESPKYTNESRVSKEKKRKMSEDSYPSKDIRSKVSSCDSREKTSTSKDHYASDKRSRKFSDCNFSAEDKGKKHIEHASKHQSSVKDLPHRSKVREYETENSNSSSSKSSSSLKDNKLSKNSTLRDKDKKRSHSLNPTQSKGQTKTPSAKCLNHLVDIDLFSVNDVKKNEVPLKEREKNIGAKERRRSEKENDSVSKSKNNNKDILNSLKPTKKRPHEHSDDSNDSKKRKFDLSSTPESYSGDDIFIKFSDIHNGVIEHADFNMTPISDTNSAKISEEMETGNLTNIKSEQDQTNALKLSRKQELKEEIANKVKYILKPFYISGMVSKGYYKEIMRRTVPKIFMNCHNCINHEKIRKLVLSYVTMFTGIPVS